MKHFLHFIKINDIKIDDLKSLKPAELGNYEILGLVLVPHTDIDGNTTFHLNPVFSDGHNSLMVHNVNGKTCPYPPGYGAQE